jgi:hypothetical protein
MKRILTYFTLLLILGITACTRNQPSTSGCNVVTVSSDISTATTWTKGNVYVVDHTIAIYATLTIQPGVIVKFTAGNGVKTASTGSIQALGTAADPIIFTAYTDDSYCGDNNGDGTATVPTKGYWGGIRLYSSAANNFTYCKVFYAGFGNPNASRTNVAVGLNDGMNTVFDHCTIAHTSSDSTYDACGLYAESATTIFTFTNNILYDNGGTVLFENVNLAYIVDNSNTFYNPANPSEKNVYQGLFVGQGSFSFSANVTLALTKIPYVILNRHPASSPGVQITLADNVILKFIANADMSLNQSNGGGFINGQGNGVLFTSIKDDTGGDSNGDGSLTSPAAGDWSGIFIANTGNTYLTWGNIIYDQH